MRRSGCRRDDAGDHETDHEAGKTRCGPFVDGGAHDDEHQEERPDGLDGDRLQVADAVEGRRCTEAPDRDGVRADSPGEEKACGRGTEELRGDIGTYVAAREPPLAKRAIVTAGLM